jgi:hypothetical protein
MHSSWADWFINNKNNDAGNRNLHAFSEILSSGDSNKEELWALVREINTVILAADSNRNIMILHSPKIRRHKVLSRKQSHVHAWCWASSNLHPARFIVPSVHNLAGCNSVNEVANIPEPKEKGLVGFEGSAIFIPGPVLWNTIIASNKKNPFKLIPIISRATRSFDKEHEFKATAITHTDNLSTWLYGVKVGLVPKTKYSVQPNNTKIATYCNN